MSLSVRPERKISAAYNLRCVGMGCGNFSIKEHGAGEVIGEQAAGLNGLVDGKLF